MHGEQIAQLQPDEKTKCINRCLTRVVQALVGDDEAQRGRAVHILSTAHPGVARRLAEKLVRKLERGDDKVRQRAQVALITAGKFAITAVALAAIQNRNSKLHFAAIGALLTIGLRLPQAERAAIIATLIDLFRAEREKP